MAKTRKDFKEEVVNSFINILNEEGLSWQQGWVSTSMENPVSKTKYRGVNRLKLLIESTRNKYEDPRWVTFNQIADRQEKYHKSEKWHLQKGAKGVSVEYAMPYDLEKKKIVSWTDYTNAIKSKEKTEMDYSVRFKYATVFNCSLVDGIKPYEKEKLPEKDVADMVNKIQKNMGVEVKLDGNGHAFYNPNSDTVHIPPYNEFYSDYELNATLLHELAHATGHSKRLNRDLRGEFGSDSYAYEELVAEMTATFLGRNLTEQSQEHIENHKGYIKSWIEILENDSGKLFEAIKEAEETNTYMEYQAELITIEDFKKDYPKLVEKIAANMGNIENANDREAIFQKKAFEKSSLEEDSIDKIRKLNKSVIYPNGSIESFDTQLIRYISGQFDSHNPFIISKDTNYLGYIDGIDVDDPLILRHESYVHIEKKHNKDFALLSRLGYSIQESVLALDSKKYDTTKLVVLDSMNNENDPIITSIRTDKVINCIDVNEISTLYTKNNFMKFLAQTYNEGLNLYCNNKTEAFINNYKGFQFPKELIMLLSNKEYTGVINRSQSEIFKEKAEKFMKNTGAFAVDDKYFYPIHKFMASENTISFISTIYSTANSLDISHSDFYKNAGSNHDLFYCLNTENIYLPTGKGLMIVPEKRLPQIALSKDSLDFMNANKQEMIRIEDFLGMKENSKIKSKEKAESKETEKSKAPTIEIERT